VFQGYFIYIETTITAALVGHENLFRKVRVDNWCCPEHWITESSPDQRSPICWVIY